MATDGVAITELDFPSPLAVAEDDLLPFVNVDDQDQSPEGSTEKATVATVFANRTLIAPTLTGNTTFTRLIGKEFQLPPSIGNIGYRFYDKDGVTELFEASILGITAFGDITFTKHLVSSQGLTPTVAALSGAGTGATAIVAGDDTAGIVTLTTGSGSITGGAAWFTVTFASTYGSGTPVVVITLQNATSPFSTSVSTVTNTTFTVGVQAAFSYATASDYLFGYQVVGYV